MNIIPKDWLQKCKMKRIILHWTGGSYHPSSLDKEHYHILIDGEGKLHKGKYDIIDNENIVDDSYAKHTYRLNTKSIGVAICCMHGAIERPFNAGKFPVTEAQFNSLVKVCAELLTFYELPLFAKTCLSHAEVEGVYGAEQKGKWDIRVIPIKNSRSPNFNMLHLAAEAGNIIRKAVEEELTKQIKQENPPHEPTTALPAAEIILPGGENRLMKTFIQPKITGYRQLSEAEVELINEIKAHGEQLGALVTKLRAIEGLDGRWISIGATDLQKGLMALTRAVAQPTTF